MNTFAPRALFIVILAMVALVTQTSSAETLQLFSVVKELQIQQTQIADNQTKIDSKIADLAETVRAARIFASRLGGAHKPFIAPKK
jgi:hypothetical protein